MKTIIKITALAVITVLAALSCAPEVTLTDRDWGEYDSQRDSALTSNRNNNTTGLPKLVDGSKGTPGKELPLLIPGQTLTIELVIQFPADADFLKTPNDQLLATLQGFLSIYTYINRPPTALNETYALSAKERDVDYVFVRRNNEKSGNDDIAKITIQLTSNSLSALPTTAQTNPSTGMVIKIDGSKYTLGGYGLDCDNDGNHGEAIYDDHFIDVAVTDHSGSYIPPGGPRTLTLTIGSLGPSSTAFATNSAAYTFTIASLTGDGIGSTDAADPGNLRRKAILEALIPQFKVQQFNAATGSWADYAATIYYQNDPNAADSTIQSKYGQLYTTFTVEDLGIYRIYASGMKGLKTSGQAGGVYEAEQKISVNVGGGSGSLRKDWYVSGNAGYYVDTRTLIGKDVLTFSFMGLNHDNAGKKATVELKFPSLTYAPTGGTTGTYYVKGDPADEDIFIKNVRIAYRTIGNYDWNTSTGIKLSQEATNTGQINVNDIKELKKGDKIRISGTEVTITNINGTAITVDGNVTADDEAEVDLRVLSKAITNINGAGDIAFARINKVEFEKIMNTSGTDQEATKVILTIDEGFKIGTTDDAYLVIAPGFKYGHDSLTFGDFTAIDTIIDGISGWALYGKIQ